MKTHAILALILAALFTGSTGFASEESERCLSGCRTRFAPGWRRANCIRICDNVVDAGFVDSNNAEFNCVNEVEN